MITSIAQVNTEFFKLFHKVYVPIGGKLVHVPSRYFKKSSYNYVENTPESYPCTTIQDFAPEMKPEWFIDTKERVSGLSENGLSAFIYRNPLWMNFRYDVSIASKGYKEFIALKDFFQRKYSANVGFIFNKVEIDGDVVGDVVPYTMRMTDIPRNDGVFEVNMEFNLSTWMQIQEPKEIEVVTEILINLRPKQL